MDLTVKDLWVLRRKDGELAQMPRKGLALCFDSRDEARHYIDMLGLYQTGLKIVRADEQALELYDGLSHWRSIAPLSYTSFIVHEEAAG